MCLEPGQRRTFTAVWAIVALSGLGLVWPVARAQPAPAAVSPGASQSPLTAPTSRSTLNLDREGDGTLAARPDPGSRASEPAAPAASSVGLMGKGLRRVALVVGNGNYQRAPLANPTHDAHDFAERLRRLGFEVIARENVTAREFGGLLGQFKARLEGSAVGLFFYAGHGVQVRGENYLPGVDEQIRSEEDVPSQSLPVRQVVEVIEGAKVPLGLLFLDACRDNPFARSTRSGAHGLSKVEAAAGMLISFATRPGSVAQDGDGQRNGLYTGQLLSAIEAAGDQPVEMMLKRVAAGVRSASKGQQDPWIEGSLTGDFCFRSCAGEALAMAAPSASSPASVAKITPAVPRAPVSGASAAGVALGNSTASGPGPESRGRPLAVARPMASELWYVHGDTPTTTGRIYRASAGRVEERFVRPAEGNRGIQAAVVGPGGDVFFCDGTETRIYRLRAGKVEPLYRHDGFVRFLAVDDRGRLHFSTSQGPRADGAIYRVDGGQATLVTPVPVAAVGGTWSGGFAFDRQGVLWASTGDAVPSGLYRLEQARWQRVFESAERPIMGFAFLPDGTVVFADNQHSVWQLHIPGAAQKLFDSPFEGRLRGIFVSDRRPS